MSRVLLLSFLLTVVSEEVKKPKQPKDAKSSASETKSIISIVCRNLDFESLISTLLEIYCCFLAAKELTELL